MNIINTIEMTFMRSMLYYLEVLTSSLSKSFKRKASFRLSKFFPIYTKKNTLRLSMGKMLCLSVVQNKKDTDQNLHLQYNLYINRIYPRTVFFTSSAHLLLMSYIKSQAAAFALPDRNSINNPSYSVPSSTTFLIFITYSIY